MRRRLALLVLVVGILLVARFGFRRPLDVDLALSFGAHAAQVRDVTLVITDDSDHVIRELHLSYPHGAAAGERHRVRLKPGRYTVAGRITGDQLPERTPSRPLIVEDEGLYPIDLAN